MTRSLCSRLLCLAALLVGPTAHAAQEWRVVAPESRVGFTATYDGIPFDARFEDFEADIQFSPDDLENSVFDVRIDVASLESGSADRDEGMKGQEWFAAGEYSGARFHADRFEAADGGGYVAIGELSLKDVSRAIEVPFTWEPGSSGGAVLTAETVLERGSFNIGTGEWAEDDIIGFDVTVKARLVLTSGGG